MNPFLWRPDQDAWLSGFIDGEGCFIVAALKRGSYCPRLDISLRADDTLVLSTIRAVLGGSLTTYTPKRAGSSPVSNLVFSKKDDLLRVVAYLDAFPLRAKKSRDYVIWRPAVIEYANHGGRSSGLAAARERLMDQRGYS